ncbi:NapC/NirT family cytochrome c [Myxococcota bacterium]|nr:NapC/NirT family cytochrome c [Myxococcota bacterium]
MESSTSELGPLGEPLVLLSLACAACAAIILLWYLVARPTLDALTKIVLLVGIAILPIASAMAGNLAGYTVTQERRFCGSCHVMTPYVEDSATRTSTTLASLHGRSPWFGHKSCYTCHADYAMFGTITTKISGLRHVWHYYTDYRDRPLEETRTTIELYEPFTNAPCLQCHSTETKRWLEKKDHVGALEELRAQTLSCVSAGCHGPAHPFSKVGRPRAEPRVEARR